MRSAFGTVVARHLPRAVLLAASVVFAPIAGAENLLVNGGFDGSLAGWTSAGGAVHSNEDANESPASGSALLVSGALATPPSISQCVELPEDATAVQLDLSLKVPEPAADWLVVTNFSFVFQPGCLGSPASRLEPLLANAEDWVRVGGAVPVPPAARSLLLIVSFAVVAPTGEAHAFLDDIVLEPVNAMLLNGDRFLVSADWETPDGATGHAVGVELTGDSGYFWFFDPSNVELIVKVLDGCALNDRVWVFAGGLTNVKVTLRVLDTLLGFEKTYENPADTAFQPLQDTNALTSCFGPT